MWKISKQDRGGSFAGVWTIWCGREGNSWQGNALSTISARQEEHIPSLKEERRGSPERVEKEPGKIKKK